MGEFVSALAVIASLVYLARQIRNSSRATKFDSHLKIRAMSGEAQRVLTDPQKARIWRTGLSDPDALTEDERLSFYSMMYLMMNTVDARLVYKSATRDSDAYRSEDDPISFLGDSPGFGRWWARARGTYNADMIAHVESRLPSLAARDT